MITRDPSNADTPRAHIFNMAAMDSLRDIGLDTECYKVGTSGDCMTHTRWAKSMAGEEYARIYSWGNDPARKGDYELASPSKPLDLPQTLLEPILTRHPCLNGFHCRFDTEFVSFEQDKSSVITTLFDKVTKRTFKVQSKYLFGADGGRSQVAEQLCLPFKHEPGGGFAVNVLIEADMAHLMPHRMGNLHWILQPDVEHPEHAWIACMRMVKPWHEWLCIIVPAPGAPKMKRPAEDYLSRVREFIGDDSVEVTIKRISEYTINESIAETYSKGNVFCLGDAVHRHPPNHGLGANTCIQDAHNLAWKIAMVERGQAGRALLDTYSIERQPVGLDVVTHANASGRNHAKIWTAFGMLESTAAERQASFDKLFEASPHGLQRRQELQRALQLLDVEEHGLGIEMNQRYQSTAVHLTPDVGLAKSYTTSPETHYHATTFPGARVPHVWLRAGPGASKLISTIDIVGKGRFTLLTGIGGHEWKRAAEMVSRDLDIDIVTVKIGFRQDYDDVYMDWARIRDVSETGAVLVRPDYFVGWREQSWVHDGMQRLLDAMRGILSR